MNAFFSIIGFSFFVVEKLYKFFAQIIGKEQDQHSDQDRHKDEPGECVFEYI
jgi:hypothetical protein